MSDPVKIFTVVALLALPTVMYGGYALLRLVTDGAPEDHRMRSFRAGHAHAGVLLVMVLATLSVLGRTDAGTGAAWTICILLQTGVVAQSGGFFVHLLRGGPTGWSPGSTLTVVGALSLAAGMVSTAAVVVTA